VTPVIEVQPMQPGDVVRTCADVTKAGRLLGYRPTTTVEEGIPRFVRWYEEAHGRQT
jgi:UDP-glucuronate 4-epimerase